MDGAWQHTRSSAGGFTPVVIRSEEKIRSIRFGGISCCSIGPVVFPGSSLQEGFRTWQVFARPGNATASEGPKSYSFGNSMWPKEIPANAIQLPRFLHRWNDRLEKGYLAMQGRLSASYFFLDLVSELSNDDLFPEGFRGTQAL